MEMAKTMRYLDGTHLRSRVRDARRLFGIFSTAGLILFAVSSSPAQSDSGGSSTGTSGNSETTSASAETPNGNSGINNPGGETPNGSAGTTEALNPSTIGTTSGSPSNYSPASIRSYAPGSNIAGFKQGINNSFIKLGPFRGTLQASAGLEYTDNSGLTSTNEISRLRFAEGLGLNLGWNFSPENGIHFNLGGIVSEDFYGNGKSETSFGLLPSSQVQFQVQIADFRIRAFDAFAFIQDPASDSSSTNTTNLNRFQNTVGGGVDWLLSQYKTVWSLYTDYSYTDDKPQTAPNQTSDALSGERTTLRVGSALSVNWTPTTTYGVDLVYSASTATGGSSLATGDVNALTVGTFLRGRLTHFTDIDLAAGVYFLDAANASSPDYYINATIRQQLNRHFQYFASFSRDLTFAAADGITSENTFRTGTSLHLTKKVTLTVGPYFLFGSVLSGANQGNFKLYGVDVGINWASTKHWKTSFGYSLNRRESGTIGDSYLENRILFGITYDF